MTDEERPVEVVYDCSTHTRTDTPLTDARWADHKAREQAAQQEEEQRKQDEESALAVVRAKAAQDPAFAALAALTGVSL